jgi:hypothetical protein
LTVHFQRGLTVAQKRLEAEEPHFMASHILRLREAMKIKEEKKLLIQLMNINMYMDE